MLWLEKARKRREWLLACPGRSVTAQFEEEYVPPDSKELSVNVETRVAWLVEDPVKNYMVASSF